MAWPKEVKDEVLVKCGRHCCICHKFCGIKIELHHIVLKSEGGEESIDNCIPLCLDCHSDQKSYDFKHPKGTKYSRDELKGHRDKWYSLVGQNLGTGSPDHLLQDQQLFHTIYQKIPPKPTIWYLQQIDFNAAKFRLDYFQPIFNILLENSLEPWIEFFDSDIQTIYGELLNYMKQFEQIIESDTFDFKDGNFNHQCVPREWEITQPARYERATKELNSLADDIVSRYTDFVRLARKKLGVILPQQE
jgi:hypothetical protein